MGFAVASALVKDGWIVTLVDVNKDTGETAAVSLGDHCQFIGADVTEYDQLRHVFEAVFLKFERIDFVFANAGIAGRADFYNKAECWPPTEPNLLVEEICLRGVIFTSHLAMHFMRRNKIAGGVIISTASGMSFNTSPTPMDNSVTFLLFIPFAFDILTREAASIYASPELPLYAAAKHGVLGLMRSMSEQLKPENIRVNSILPGAVRTTLHSTTIWDQFPQSDFTTIEQIVRTVLDLIADVTATGRAMEISSGETFNRKQHDYCNETMRKVMEGKSY